jgi:hypothetical protein
LQVWR